MDLTEAKSIETDDVELCHPETLSLSYGYNPQDFDGAIKVCIFAYHLTLQLILRRSAQFLWHPPLHFHLLPKELNTFNECFIHNTRQATKGKLAIAAT